MRGGSRLFDLSPLPLFVQVSKPEDEKQQKSGMGKPVTPEQKLLLLQGLVAAGQK